MALGMAFTINSLFYCKNYKNCVTLSLALLRVQGKCKLIEDHPVMRQTDHVKGRYLKLQEALQAKERKNSGKNERSRLDKEATERMIKHAIGS